MTKNRFAPSIVVIAALSLGAFGATAAAQPAAGSPPAAAAGAPAAAPADGSAAAPATPPAAPAAAADAHQACVAAMNADPKFEAEIVKIADEKAQLKRDADTIAAHTDANYHIQKNERHVIYAYAGMWIIAAAFVIFLWRRQQSLKLEIAQLRRDLEAAADDSKLAEKRS